MGPTTLKSSLCLNSRSSLSGKKNKKLRTLGKVAAVWAEAYEAYHPKVVFMFIFKVVFFWEEE